MHVKVSMKIKPKTYWGGALFLAVIAVAFPALADEVGDRVTHLAYALDTFYFLVTGALVMWMAAGFTMLEAGLVRSKHRYDSDQECGSLLNRLHHVHDRRLQSHVRWRTKRRHSRFEFSAGP
jgi:hypothetical protein